MTDTEIIECLNSTEGKEHIGIYCTDTSGNYAATVKLDDVVSLINRQKAEIERLKEEIKNLDELVVYNASCCTRLHKELFKAKSEAIREFAERLYRRIGYCDLPNVVIKGHIDNLVKEMVGDE